MRKTQNTFKPTTDVVQMIALLITIQSITQIAYILRRILSSSIINNNKDNNFSQLLPCAIVTLPI